MSKTSTATVRARPVPDVTTASGAFRVDAETFTIDSSHRIEVIDLTDRVMTMVRARPIREGLVSLCSLHTTCTVFVNEFQQALRADMQAFLEQAVAGDGQWLHNHPDHSDCDRMNAAAHLRAMLLGHSLTLPLGHGEIVLGQWQRVLMAELDGPRTRSLRLTVMGVE
jgi:secondary thiamine-phosphate synthase enzyme